MNRLSLSEIKKELINLNQVEKNLNKLYAKYKESRHYVRMFEVRSDLGKLEDRRKYLQEEYDKYQRSTLGQLIPREELVRNDVYKKLVEISLAADYQLQTIEDFRDTLNKLGVESSDIFNEVRECATLCQKTASRLLEAQGLSKVLLENEDLLHSLHEVTLNYINKTLEL